MASMRDIQRRKLSVESTGQITKAMKLVSTVKLQKARGRAESSKPYFDGMYDTVASILARSGNIKHRFLKNHPDTGDRIRNFYRFFAGFSAIMSALGR